MYLFHISTMVCGGCLGAVTRAIQAADNSARIEADLGKREIRVTSSRSEGALLAALRAVDLRRFGREHGGGYAACLSN